MIDESDVRTYRQDDVLWIEASRDVAAPSQAAWDAIEPLFHRLAEVGTSSGAEIEVVKQSSDTSLVAEGNQVAALVTQLAIFKTVLIITFEEVEPGQRVSCAVTVLGSRYGELEFLIEPTGADTCRITYRQSIRGQDTMTGMLNTAFDQGPQHVPEVAQVHSLWEEIIVGAGGTF
jgi:hypothetical protein